MTTINHKENLFENKSSFLSHVNTILSNSTLDLIILEPHNVPVGKGVSKTLVNIDICKKGKWVAIFTFDMTNYTIKRNTTLGTYSKQQTTDIISEAYNAVAYIIDGFHELDGTNESRRQKEATENAKKEYIAELESIIYEDFLYNEAECLSVTPEQYYNNFITTHNINESYTKEILLSRIERKYKRLAKEGKTVQPEQTTNEDIASTNEVSEVETVSNEIIGINVIESFNKDQAITTNSPMEAWEQLTQGNQLLMNDNELNSLQEYIDTLSDDEQDLYYKHFASKFDKSLACGLLTRSYVCKLNNYTPEAEEQPETFHLYKNTFSNYSDAYDHALQYSIPTTMIISSLHPTLTNERLQHLEHELTFSKSNMLYSDMQEYFTYIDSLQSSYDTDERYYKLKSMIQRYEYKQQSKLVAENEQQRLSIEGSRLLVFMKEHALQLSIKESTQWYYYKGEHVYSFHSCSVEQYHNDMLNLFNKYFPEYTNEYNASQIYYYKGNEFTTLSMDNYPIGWISYNNNTQIAVFNRPLTNEEINEYNLTPCETIQVTA